MNASADFQAQLARMIENNEIRIISGEGEVGTVEPYTGKRTVRALQMRLRKERSGGDRFARAEVFSHSNEWGDAFIDIETREYHPR